MASSSAAPAASDRIDGPLLRLMLVMIVGGLMGMLDTSIVNVGIDTLGRNLHASLKTIEWVASGYLLAMAATIPLSGWAAERFGAKSIWLTGLVVFMVGSILSASSWDAGSLIAFRVVQGIGAGILEPTLLTLLARAAGPARAGKMIGLVGVTITLGPIIGPVLGGAIVGNIDWRWMFLINIPIGLVAFVLALRVVPADIPSGSGPPKFDFLGVALLCPGFVALAYGLSQASGGTGFGTVRVIVAIALGVVLVIGYVLHALRTTAPPLVDVRLFRGRAFGGGVGAVFLTGFLLFSLLLLIPLYYQEAWGHGVFESGLLLVPQGAGVWVAMPIAGILFGKIGARPIIPVGGVLAALGLAGFAFFGAGTSITVLIICSVVTGLGLGAIGAPAMSLAFASVPPASVPSATASLYLANQIGGSLGIAVGALVLQDLARTHSVLSSFQGTFGYLIAIAVLVAIVGLLLPRFRAPAAAPTVELAAELATEGVAESA
jgi:EmrB/QacA subfamily drug resistance transporter